MLKSLPPNWSLVPSSPREELGLRLLGLSPYWLTLWPWANYLNPQFLHFRELYRKTLKELKVFLRYKTSQWLVINPQYPALDTVEWPPTWPSSHCSMEALTTAMAFLCSSWVCCSSFQFLFYFKADTWVTFYEFLVILYFRHQNLQVLEENWSVLRTVVCLYSRVSCCPDWLKLSRSWRSNMPVSTSGVLEWPMCTTTPKFRIL